MDWEERIELNPEILVGKPVVRGTRLSVQLIIERLADGWTTDEVVDQYPTLTKDDVLACLRYASGCVQAVSEREQGLRRDAVGRTERIERNPAVLVGKPVIKGTRLSVEFVLDRLADSWTTAELVGKYPNLAAADVSACLRYTSELLQTEQAKRLVSA